MAEKSYACKNEELPVIAGYLLSSLKRDLSDFTIFSPRFDGAYVTNFEAKIAAVKNVLNPQAETAELKIVTEHLYNAMDTLLNSLAKLERYIKMAGSEVPVSIKDFGLSKLRQRIWVKDAEGVLAELKTVNSYIDTYKSALTAQGLSDELTAFFHSSVTTVHDYNQRQYEIVSGRKRLVENNQILFNELYGMISEICDTGKVIYRGNAVATQKYTFAALKKQVRIVHHSQVEKPSSNNNQSLD